MTTLTKAELQQVLDALELMRYHGIVDDEWDAKALALFDASIAIVKTALLKGTLIEAESHEPVSF